MNYFAVCVVALWLSMSMAQTESNPQPSTSLGFEEALTLLNTANHQLVLAHIQHYKGKRQQQKRNSDSKLKVEDFLFILHLQS